MYKPYVYILALVLLCSSCAQVVSISGGPKDTEPPQLLRSTPPDSALHIIPEYFTFEFNENVSVLNKTPIFLNPLISSPLEIEVMANKAIIKIPKDSLKSNTTYQFNVSEILGDEHEKNPFVHSPFLFSTGFYSDSVTLKTKIHNTTKWSLNQLQVCLFKDSQDYRKGINNPPYYRFKASTESQVYKGLKPGTYDIFAFNDANKNLIFDSADEPCAILKTPFTLFQDTSIDLQMFLAEDRPAHIKSYRFINAEQILIELTRKTKFKIQSTEVYAPSGYSDTVLCNLKTFRDTISIKVFFPDIPLADSIRIPRTIYKRATFKPKQVQAVDSGFVIEFPVIIPQHELINTIMYSSTTDTLHFKPLTRIQTISPTQFKCKVADSVFALKIDSNAFKSSNGSIVSAWQQRVTYPIQILSGTVTVFFNKPLVQHHALLQLRHLNSNFTTSMTYDVTKTRYTFYNVPQGEFELNCISDFNNDLLWTSGSYVKRRLPEPIQILKNNIRVQNEWETEIKIE